MGLKQSLGRRTIDLRLSHNYLPAVANLHQHMSGLAIDGSKSFLKVTFFATLTVIAHNQQKKTPPSYPSPVRVGKEARVCLADHAKLMSLTGWDFDQSDFVIAVPFLVSKI